MVADRKKNRSNNDLLSYRRFYRRAAALLTGVLLSSPLMAEEADRIVTDRPDFVESSDVVGKWRFQIETSVALERNKRNGLKDQLFSTPTLFRLGVADEWEVRLETDGRLIGRSEEPATRTTSKTNGYADTSIGGKVHLVDEKDGSPSIGLLGHIDLDSGTSDFRGQGKRPSLRLPIEWDLPNDFSLGVMPGILWDRDSNNQRFVSGIFGVVLGRSWNDSLRSFIEIAAPQIARGQHGGNIVTFDIGAAWLLSNTLQVDTALSRGLNRNTSDLSWTIGVSVKF